MKAAMKTYMMGRGVVSAARMTISETPRFRVSVSCEVSIGAYELKGTWEEKLTSALVGALLKLAVVAGLLDKVQERLGESLVGDGPSGAGICKAVPG